MVKALADFGQVAYGKEQLRVLLNFLQDRVGADEGEFIAGLFAAYPLNDVCAVRNRASDRWRGTESVDDVHERIIGENTLRDVNMLELALEAAQAVVRIGLPAESGSGFMIASDLAMTNHHVVAPQEEAAHAEFTFNQQLDRAGKVCETATTMALAEGAFCTNPQLEYTVVQLRTSPLFGSPHKLRAAPVRRDDRVSIIQHPGGHFKKISMQNNFVAYADNQVRSVHHEHRAGLVGIAGFQRCVRGGRHMPPRGEFEEPGTGRRYLRNAGTSMIAVLADLKASAPAVFARLAR